MTRGTTAARVTTENPRFWRVIAARAIRNAAYGSLAVVFGVILAGRGLSPAFVGLLITLALVSGAAATVATGPAVERVGRRATLVGGALLMTLAGALFALSVHPALLVVAVLLGTISPGGQEVGPFGALEQEAIADTTGLATRRFAWYNVFGTLAAAVGALAAAVLPSAAIAWGYSVAGIALATIYAGFPERSLASAVTPAEQAAATPRARRGFGNIERLASLYALDAFAGGFVVQSFIAYWLFVRFGVGATAIGTLFFVTNILNAISYLVAARLADRFGLLATMVGSHLLSNLALLAIPLMPSYLLAAAALGVRAALSQMDVPTRQAFTMAVSPPGDRAYAAGLTNAVRPAAAAVAPALAGLAVQGAAFGVPMFAAGGLKIVYDLAIWLLFRNVKLRS